MNTYIEYISVLAYYYPSIYDWLDMNGYLKLLHGIPCTYAPTQLFTLKLILERKTKNVQNLIDNIKGVIECNQITSTLLSTYPSILSNGMQKMIDMMMNGDIHQDFSGLFNHVVLSELSPEQQEQFLSKFIEVWKRYANTDGQNILISILSHLPNYLYRLSNELLPFLLAILDQRIKKNDRSMAIQCIKLYITSFSIAYKHNPAHYEQDYASLVKLSVQLLFHLVNSHLMMPDSYLQNCHSFIHLALDIFPAHNFLSHILPLTVKAFTKQGSTTPPTNYSSNHFAYFLHLIYLCLRKTPDCDESTTSSRIQALAPIVSKVMADLYSAEKRVVRPFLMNAIYEWIDCKE